MRLDNLSTMTELLEQIKALIADATRDIERIEHTLTDGYAHALWLEAEKSRLQKRLTEVTQGLQRGDTAKKTREISELADRLDGNTGDLVRLRGMLNDLRRHADDVRVGSPS